MKLDKIFACFFLITLLGLSSCKKREPESNAPYLNIFKNLQEGDDAFALVFTSSVEGYVEPCGCTSTPLGGIARFAKVFSEIKTKTSNRLAMIDTGNLLFEFPSRNPADHCQDEARIELLLSSLSSMGLTATLPGPLDDSLGLDYRNNLYKKYNISQLTISEPKIINTPKYDIALFAITQFDAQTGIMLKKIIEKLKETKNIKLVVAISSLPLEKTKLHFNNSEYIDIIIQGRLENMHSKRASTLGDKGPLLIEGGRQGQYFTFLLLQNLAARTSQKLELDNREFEITERLDLLPKRIAGLNAQKKQADKSRLSFIEQRIALAQNELATLREEKAKMPRLTTPNVLFQPIALTKTIAPHQEIGARLSLYEKSIPRLVKACEENIACPTASKNEATYVGATTCKGCHQEAYKVWQKATFMLTATDESGNIIKRETGHAKAWQTLVDKNKDADRSCVGCHSIGFMKNGGYCKTSQVDFRKDVQCESCHGAGSLHAQNGDPKLISRTVSESTCRGCHHVPHIESPESFNYHEKVMKILGPGHGEKLLKQLQHTAK